jgi:hypothetical protein
MKCLFGFSGQDEHPADAGDQAYDDEGLRIQGASVFDRDSDRMKQLRYDEEQKGLIEDCQHGRRHVEGASQDKYNLAHCVGDQCNSQCGEQYRDDYVDGVFRDLDGTNYARYVPAGTGRHV